MPRFWNSQTRPEITTTRGHHTSSQARPSDLPRLRGKLFQTEPKAQSLPWASVRPNVNYTRMQQEGRNPSNGSRRSVGNYRQQWSSFCLIQRLGHNLAIRRSQPLMHTSKSINRGQPLTQVHILTHSYSHMTSYFWLWRQTVIASATPGSGSEVWLNQERPTNYPHRFMRTRIRYISLRIIILTEC